MYPFPLIDGIIQPTWSSFPSYANAIAQRKAISSNYSINFNVQGNGEDYQANISVGQISANNVNKVLHVVLTESHIPESWYGGEEVNFVTRLMLPDQYGTPLLGKPNFDFYFTVETDWLADSCQLVAFVQDTITKEIFQAQSFLLYNAILTYYDVALQEIILPSEDFCINEIAPLVEIKNQSYENLESCLIAYEINGDIHEFGWVGNLQVDSTLQILLPEVSFELLDENYLIINVSLPNGEVDENPDNNMLGTSFNKAQVISAQQLVLELMTDNFGNETSWEIYNSLGELVFSGSGYENNTYYSIDIDFVLDDCYMIIISDEGENGICCENGDGYYRIKDVDGALYFEGGEFSTTEMLTFQIDKATATHQTDFIFDVNVYPNPVTDIFYINSTSEIKSIEIYNYQGQLVFRNEANSFEYSYKDSGFSPGIYILKIETKKENSMKRIIIK